MFTRSLPPLRAKFPSALRLWALLVTCHLSLVTLSATPTGAIKFDIPAQPAASALQAFAKQAGMEVLFPFDELKKVQAREVKGELEPADALRQLLAGTGYEARQTAARNFVVRKAETATTGSVKGSLVGEGGKGLPDVLVTIRETAQSATTDKYGQYVFPKVAAGTYVLVAAAPGYQPMHITDVAVKAGQDLTLGKEEMHRALGDVTTLEPMVVHADTVEQLEKIEVTSTKAKPFTTANVDLPRTINDVQPYIIFEAKDIEQSGAVNLEDFLKNRLTMNAQVTSNSLDSANTTAALSQVNLRGLGTNGTLILVNGRRALAGAFRDLGQGDVNAIPPDAVERVEVLPSSASGIYGGAALGGVINIVLKSHFSGGKLSFGYETPTDTSAVRRNATLTYGLSLEDGRTEVMVSASVADSGRLLRQDRSAVLERYRQYFLQNRSPALFAATTPYLGGTTPNIAATTTLTLKNGKSLGATNTFVPVGAAPGADLSAGYLANAGQFNFQIDPGNSSQYSARFPLGWNPRNQAVTASVSRRMTSWLEAYADFNYSRNVSQDVVPLFTSIAVAPTSPVNPFQQTVTITIPSNLWESLPPSQAIQLSRGFDVGLKLHLPKGWTGLLDYSWVRSSQQFTNRAIDFTALRADLASGALNPFVDTLQYPLDDQFRRYLSVRDQTSFTGQRTVGLRLAGDLWSLPWGAPTLMLGFEHAVQALRGGYLVGSPVGSSIDYPGHASVTDSGWTELNIPLITQKNARLLLRRLDVQLAGRADYYQVDTGTTTITTNSLTTPPTVTYAPAAKGGGPVSATERFHQASPTVGLKWQPFEGVIVRASTSRAFLPPTFTQLVPNPIPSTGLTTITDPKTNATYGVNTFSGGNPNLLPKTSRSWNAGVIYEPPQIKGLRLNAEYYAIDQNNVITTLTAAQMVIEEDNYPGRVIRDAATGRIVTIDLSNLNANKYDTRGWDFSADYRRQTSFGTVGMHAGATVIVAERHQITFGGPILDYAGFVSEGGENRRKGNATLDWARGAWTAGWTVTHYGSYHQTNTPGSPSALRGTNSPNTYLAQGANNIAPQTYHDFYAGYDFGRRTEGRFAGAVLRGMTLQVGLKNVFNTAPPYDANYAPFYASPFGDLRMRTIWMKLGKAF